MKLEDGTVVVDNDTTSERKGIYQVRRYMKVDRNKNQIIDPDEKAEFYSIVYNDSLDHAQQMSDIAFSVKPNHEAVTSMNFDAIPDAMFAVKINGKYHVAASLNAGFLGDNPDFSKLPIHALDVDGKGLFEYVDWNMDGDLDDYVSYQGEFFFAGNRIMDDTRIISLLNRIPCQKLFLAGNCFAGELLGGKGKRIAAFSNAPPWNYSLGNILEESIIAALARKDTTLACDPGSGRITAYDLINFLWDIDPYAGWDPEFGNYKAHYDMMAEADGDRRPTFVRDIWGTSDGEALKRIVLKENRISSGCPDHHIYALKDSLYQNFPNPFSKEAGTTIMFTTEKPARARVDIHNLRGQLVKTLFDEDIAPGSHTKRWDCRDERGNDVSSGEYIYRISFPGSGRTASKKMIILR